MITLLLGQEEYKKQLELQKILQENTERYDTFSKECMDKIRNGNTIFGRNTVFVQQEALENSKDLFSYLDNPDGADLIISVGSLGRGKKLIAKLQKNAKTIRCDKLKEDEFRSYLLRAISKLGEKKSLLFKRECRTRITERALNLFVERSGYLEDEKVSLCGVNLALKELIYFDSDDITEEMIECILPGSVSDDARKLQERLFFADYKTAMEIADQISQKGEVVGVLGLLLRSFRIGWKTKMLRLPNKEAAKAVGLNDWSFRYVAPVMEYTNETIEKAMSCLEKATNDIKAGRIDSRNVFILAVGRLVSILS